ncbi:MAG TPA: hypothetical protein GXX55_11530 [Firmicutes bacterium]|nr:hypothetical protein [Bacillota bacterium]
MARTRSLSGVFVTCTFLALGVLLDTIAVASSYEPVYKDPSAPIEARVADLLSRMTLEEKVDLLHGVTGQGATGYIAGNERLGIPALTMEDGPVGVRRGKATAFPASIAMAATWNPDLIHKVGEDIGDEVKAKGRAQLLGPMVNILRIPQGGRNFEGFGEDPYLVSRMAVAYIRGVQSQGVIATVKHYAANNQEYQRFDISADVDERTLREIYLPAFQAAVQEAGVWSVMSAYNRVNGVYCTEHAHLQKEILKDEWGFKGFVVSDWGATHSTVEAARNGLDVEMPGSAYFGFNLVEAVRDGAVSEEQIDEMAGRVLRAMFAIGLFNTPREPREIDMRAHGRDALQVEREGIVLLKNDGGLLPLDPGKVKRVALIGPHAAIPLAGGGGSSRVDPFYTVSPLDALASHIPVVRYAEGPGLGRSPLTPIDAAYLIPEGEEGKQGLKAEYFPNRRLQGRPALTRIDREVNFDWGAGGPGQGIGSDNFSVRWTGKVIAPVTGEYEFGTTSDDGARLWVDGKLVINNWSDHAATTSVAKIQLEGGKSYTIRLEYYENQGDAVIQLGWKTPLAQDEMDPDIVEAVELAKQADVAIIFASDWRSEGADRETNELPGRQNELIRAVAAANPNTVVVLNTGGPVFIESWVDHVPALLEVWYGGQEVGNAVADVLLGKVNPSGKLPVTFPKRWEDYPMAANEEYYPGVAGHVKYNEGIFVGYRHFDRENIEPRFPFGYGLSYTTFEFNRLQITPVRISPDGHVTISFNVTNTGKMAGAEVAQLYVQDPEASVERPVKELKGFAKVFLNPGETRTVTFDLDPSALAFYDVEQRQWVVEPGQFNILIGSSSRDIRLTGSFTVAAETPR